MKTRSSIFLRFFISALLIVATAGVTLHEHVCSMMGRSVSLVAKDDCCAPLRNATGDASGEAGAFTRVPCCQNTVQTISLDMVFEYTPVATGSGLTFAAVIAESPSPTRPFNPAPLLLAGDISPHSRHSTSECVNNLRT